HRAGGRGGHGTADPGGHRIGRHHGHRADAGAHARPGRGDRLSPIHRLPVPRRTPRRGGAPTGRRGGHGHGRLRGRVRRGDGDHRAGRTVRGAHPVPHHHGPGRRARRRDGDHGGRHRDPRDPALPRPRPARSPPPTQEGHHHRAS